MTFEKGQLVEVTQGKDRGARGTVFWIGPNKYGPGQRLGLKNDEGETVWATDTQVRVVGESDDQASDEPIFERLENDDTRNPSLGAHIHFVDAPPDKVLEALGARWARWPGAREASDSWRFAGAFAEVMYDPKNRDWHTSHDALERLLRELHVLAPIRKAELFAGSVGVPEPKPVISQAFERGVRSVLADGWQANVDQLRADVAALGMSLTEVERPQYASPDDFPEWARAWIVNEGDKLSGRPEHPTLYTADTVRTGVSFWLGPRGALTRAGQTRLAVRQLDGPTQTIWEAEAGNRIIKAHWLDESHVVVLAKKGLIILQSNGDKYKQLAKGAGAGTELFLFQNGLIIVGATIAHAKKRSCVRLFSWHDGKLKRIATLKVPGIGVSAVPGEIPILTISTIEGDIAWRHFELHGASEMLAKKRPKPTRK